MKIDLLYPVLPPSIDGIGDYTALLAAELAKGHTVRILTSEGNNFTPIPNVEIVPTFSLSNHSTFHRLFDSVERAQTDWLVLQYNPFGFGRRGYNLTLPRVMERISRESRQTKVAMMSHESYVPLESFKWFIMRLWQRPQFRKLLHVASISFFSVEFRIAMHRSWEPDRPLIHLPVGANIPQVEISREEARQRLGIRPDDVVIGVFGQAHMSRSFEPIRRAIDALRKKGLAVTLLYIGPDGEQVKTQLTNVKMIVDGPHPPDEVSKRLAAIDVFVATYSDGLTTRRGAFIAGMQHGLPLVGTISSHTGDLLAAENGKSFLLSPPQETDQMVANVLRLVDDRSFGHAMGRNARTLYDRAFAWPVIAKTMLAEFDAFDQSHRSKR
ncbi:glycosyltransferase family 4 protein [soil metagenome]